MADQNFPGVPEVGPPQPVKIRAFKLFDGKQYSVFTNAQAIAQTILTLPPGQEISMSTLMLDPTRCDLSKVFADGGCIMSPKNID
jgi:hypothetical protein